MAKVSVLFVCLGNICRSPTAEGIFRALVRAQGLEQFILIDSAGTHAYHIGEAPDVRAQAAAARRGIDLSGLRGRQATRADIETFDFILAMDHENLAHLRNLSPPGHEHKVRLFLEFAPQRPERDVPDPYFGGAGGFDRVLDMVEEAAAGLLEHIRRERLE